LGFAATALKKLYGARFKIPSSEIVEIQPMGAKNFSWSAALYLDLKLNKN